MRRLSGKVAIVTGGTNGIGLAVSEAFVREDAAVVMASVDPPAAMEEALKRLLTIRPNGCDVDAVYCDVSRPESVDALVNTTLGKFDRVDILINNAGVSKYFDLFGISLDDWQRTVDVNYRGVFLCSRAVASTMIERQIPGRIITTTSIGVHFGSENQLHYTPTKAAAHNLMMSLAVALGRYGITCNSVAPGGPIITDMTRSLLADSSLRSRMEEGTCLGRLGDPSDVAGAYVYLASDEAKYTTGAEIRVDGGASIKLA